ncbi:SMC-Scp complex subunit ScpB [Thermogemmata fonticola]|uniref:SMC-Scp complex subunit ScpB n=1 Tax=Thermogemmata fonticola TaxID=2755323 RepID=A0A7V8VG98_9BACT|nr:SMC-Scp complex subunit ScpB [Thermogemmata fonticola]MBA2227365.1 SMC-Scp complex subunit ScpB [Thermogemmata fonticola]
MVHRLALGTSRRWGVATRRPAHVRPADLPNRGPWLRTRLRAPAAADDPLARDPLLARLEAVLLLADEPLSLKRLTEAALLPDTAATAQLLARLEQLYDADQTAFQIAEVAGGYQLLTRAVYHPWLARLRHTGRDLHLGPAAWETLALIAYKQPITRAEIEKIRGTQAVEPLRVLLEKGLVQVVGRQDSLGRPQLYGTTRRFLQLFGLKSLEDLPHIHALKKPPS